MEESVSIGDTEIRDIVKEECRKSLTRLHKDSIVFEKQKWKSSKKIAQDGKCRCAGTDLSDFKLNFVTFFYKTFLL